MKKESKKESKKAKDGLPTAEQQLHSTPDRKLIEMATLAVDKLCKTGAKSFTMTVPPRVDDTDMVFTELIRRFEEKVILK